MNDGVIEPIYLFIGMQIKKAREELNLSQAQLATIIKVSAPTLTTYENGSRRIPLHILNKLEAALGKSHSFFISDSAAIPKSAKDMIISVANQLSNAIYLPVIDYAKAITDETYDIYDFSNKGYYPFPSEIGEGANIVFKVNSKYYLLNNTQQLKNGDIVFMSDHDISDDESEEITVSYVITTYSDLGNWVDPEDVYGIIKAVIEIK